MRSLTTRRTVAVLLCAGVFGAWIVPTLAATKPPGTQVPSHPPTPNQLKDACADQLTRPADETFSIGTSKNAINKTITTAPVATGPVGLTAAVCKRRAIDINVPANPGPCPNCNLAAEISVCAGNFAGSTFEKFCTVPTNSTAEVTCKKFQHHIEVYKKAAGQTEFVLVQNGKYLYQGFMSSIGCRVAASTYGQTHNYDTAEVKPNVTRPTSGVDVYRILSEPLFDGTTEATVVFVEFE